MKKIIAFLVVVFVLVSCDTPNGGNGNTPNGGNGNTPNGGNGNTPNGGNGNTPNGGNGAKQPKFADLTDAKALFIGSTQGRSIRSVIIQENKLYKVNSAGEIEPVTFTDEDGNIIQARVSGLSKKSKNFFCLRLYYGTKDIPILAEASTGRLFILEGVDIRYCVSEILGTREIVYAPMNTGTIYKLNLDTLNAVPLNNPEFDRFYGYFWYFDNEQNAVFVLPQPDNTIIISDIATGSYRIDLNGITPPQKITANNTHGYEPPALGTSADYLYGYPLNTGYGLDITKKLPVFAAGGNFYSFETSGNDLRVYLNGTLKETLSGAVISTDNEMLGINAHYAYDMDDMYIYKSGVLRLAQNVDGTIDYSFQPKDLEFLFEAGAQYYYKNGTVYCLNGNIFKKANPLTDTEYTMIYSSTKTVKRSWMIDENIFFSSYNSATSISTHVINKGETISTEVNTSEMEITSIIEFTF